MRAQVSLVLALFSVVSGCGLIRSGTGGSSATSAAAQLRNADNRVVGTVSFAQTGRGVLLSGSLSGLGSGTHAIHVHAVGRCDRPDFQSAGAHFEPGSRKHGFRNPEGPHAGDLPNLTLPASGELRFDLMLPDVTLGGENALLDDDGAALVVHLAADDYTTDPSGNSGARIACGVISGR